MENLKDFVILANYLDQKGFFEAADIIDKFIKSQIKSIKEEGRKEAKILRKKLADKKPYDLPYLFERYEERAKEDPTLKFQTPVYEEEEEEDIGGSEYDLLDLFEDDQDAMDIMASLGIEKLAQPNLQGLTEEQRKKIQLIRNPGLASQWANYFRSQNIKVQQSGPIPVQQKKITQKDFPQPLTQKDFPQPLTQKDFPEELKF